MAKLADQNSDINTDTTRASNRIIPKEDIADDTVIYSPRVVVKIYNNVNYSRLHNGRSIFEDFMITPGDDYQGERIHVKITLSSGRDHSVYESDFILAKPARQIRNDIHLPLAWEYAETLVESVIASVFVQVRFGGDICFRHTFRVRINPYNEWKDNERDGAWLPSFVLPRDPAIEQIIDLAKKNLTILTGQYSSRFIGYQDGDNTDYDSVDNQVKAIWQVLSFDLKMNYIEPPPAYSKDIQRLRTPSQVINFKQGTCIDLCLVLAACIEYIGIYPVIFLEKGHAFTGYWSSLSAHDEFIKNKQHDFIENEGQTDLQVADDYQGKPGSEEITKERRKYQFNGSNSIPLIQEAIKNDDLVPLEATLIPEHTSISAAINEGYENMGNFNNTSFDAMLDIHKARQEQITPLPIRKLSS